MEIQEITPDQQLPCRVPEHSLPLMTGLSGGKCLKAGEYIFYAADDWLMGIGYPLKGPYRPLEFEEALSATREATGATSFFAIAPEMPQNLAPCVVEQDRFYLLGTGGEAPSRLVRLSEKAALSLSVRESASFLPEHRRLWIEFLSFRQAEMKARVAELYRRVPAALEAGKGRIRLLDALDADGHLVASLLVDYSPELFSSYVLGAHSRKYAINHAMDLLFLRMLEISRREGKRFINLGLGVNEGILRFKIKWKARPGLTFQMAEWQEQAISVSAGVSSIAPAGQLALAVLRGSGVSARKMLDSKSSAKPFAMLWEVEKEGRRSWLGGTAHFFCHRFEYSFRKLFENVDNVIFEGPLDPVFMGQVDAAGKKLEAGLRPLYEMLSGEEIGKLEKVVHGPQGLLARSLGVAVAPLVDIRKLLQTGRYWYVFFTIWTSFLYRQGWSESVDMEAWKIAREMRKNVIGMENLEEQLAALGSLPVDRVVRFFRNCDSWKRRAFRNRAAYLAGDLEGMMGSSAEFPTHTEHVLDKRDQRFRERMRKYLEQGRAAVFVGSAHMVNLRHMLAEDGFRIRQKPFGVWPALHLAYRNRFRPDEKVIW